MTLATATAQYKDGYMRCPYEDCSSNQLVYGTGDKRPSSLGMYKVKNCGDNVLIFQCQKCSRPFRVKIFGVILRWADMSFNEKRTHHIEEWVVEKLEQ